MIHKCQHPVTHGSALQTETPKVVLINRGIRRVELSRQVVEPDVASGLESVLEQTFPSFEARKPEETIKLCRGIA